MGCPRGSAWAVVTEWHLWLFLLDHTGDARFYGTGCRFSGNRESLEVRDSMCKGVPTGWGQGSCLEPPLPPACLP